jgi:hypothetical protein
VRVKGRAIKRVTFFVGGKRLKTDTRAPFTLNVGALGPGVFHVKAKVFFKAGAARPKTLKTTVRQSAAAVLRPPFTG